ncbi:MAG: hypothetical protein LBB05_01585 [Puniceicoccales bacterium]|nr:hypothetical protein [Puniceicoccales bacterium]
MSEKEINPLKRGRMQRQVREQKKKSTPGEIFDPLTVLDDSIAAQNYRQSKVPHEYIPSKRIDNAKTTIVDAVDLRDTNLPLGEETIRPPRNGNRPQSFQNNSRRNESNVGHRPPDSKTQRTGNCNEASGENSHCDEKSECGIKCLWDRILSFLGLGSRRHKSCSCPQKNNREDKAKNCRTNNNRCSNSRYNGNRFRSSQNKFK